jgi:uncharacterized protein (TIGR03032 family)
MSADSSDVENAHAGFNLMASRGFNQWLFSTGGSIAFTTYQAGKLFFLGLNPEGQLSVFERTFPRCMGMAVSADTRQLYLATANQMFRFDNALPDGETHNGYDTLFVPRVSWITGDLDIHDVALDAAGSPFFVNTLFSCLAALSDGFSFRPEWRPSFISKLAAEDRCHLNGLAMRNGTASHVSSVSTSDVNDGWRDFRQQGGVIIDVDAGTVVADGLSMPHSPRWYGDQLWLINSGSGDFGKLDLSSGRFEPVAFCPGFGRGLAFANQCALIGLSLPRTNQTFQGLALDYELERRNAKPRCGLQIVDLQSGQAVHWVRISGVVSELYDVAFLLGVRRPSAAGFKGDDINRILTMGSAPAEC